MHFLIGAGYRDIAHVPGEHEWRCVPDVHISPSSCVALKYPRMVSKHWVDLAESVEDVREALAAGVGVVFMVRDPKAVLLSRHPASGGKFYVPPSRWAYAARMLLRFRQHANVQVVRFETLVTDPATIQRQLRRAFHLQDCRTFAGCHRHFRTDDPWATKAMGGHRPLDPSRLEPWKTCSAADVVALRRRLRSDAALPQLARALGYDCRVPR